MLKTMGESEREGENLVFKIASSVADGGKIFFETLNKE